MDTSSSSSSSAEESISQEPLLRQPPATEPTRPNRLAALIGRAAGRRGASMVVRQTAARRLEERRADWAYSRPVVAVDILWNLAFAVASVVVVSTTLRERPGVPLRVWVAGYAFFCVVHAVLVGMEYRRRRRGFGWRNGEGEERAGSGVEGDDSGEESNDDGDGGRRRGSHPTSFAKRCESLNTVASFLWWILGFYWVVSGGETLLQNAPKLYWLAILFLAFDVVFAIVCLALACVIGIALCCCLPCIIAILYAVAGQEGASDADMSILPRYKYEETSSDEQKMVADAGRMIPIGNNNGDMVNECSLLHEDAECCICLTAYEDGVELTALPCNHHFHSSCIIKWLQIHATCPLCKYNILKGNEHV